MFFILVAGCLLSGCGKGGSPPTQTNTTSGGNPITAPVDYLGAVAKGQQKSQATVALASLSQAINMFSAQEGRLPKDLNELVGPEYLPRLPVPPAGMKFDYDPTTGVVKVVPQ